MLTFHSNLVCFGYNGLRIFVVKSFFMFLCNLGFVFLRLSCSTDVASPPNKNKAVSIWANLNLLGMRLFAPN